MNGKDGHGLKLEKIAPTFSGFNAMPAKLSKKLILLVLSDKNLCDIFFLTLQEDFSVWVKAPSYDFSTELT